MTRTPRISVVIPHYNSSDTIRRALAGVKAQTEPPLEVIVVDDCSHPEELERLRAVCDADAQIPVRLLVQENNQGPATARNRGWEAARGDWIAFLDSDDSWHPQRLELQVLALSPDTLMISSDTQVVEPDQHSPEILSAPIPKPVRLSLGRHLVRNPHTTPSVLLRRDVPVRFTAGRFHAEDYELWIRVADLGEVLTLPVPLTYLYKDHFGVSGLSSQMWKMIVGEHRTFSALRQDGVISLPKFVIAEAIMAVRVVRRLGLRTLRTLRAPKASTPRG
ncbi:glycosyltransferase family 2 protein [Brachybacterium paraconglomeratum]|uniref:glycosyltransferase family 2 protein n=1 Tax=Brachybacterium paraconglomeratum TaxID=173362 RepID=UPI0021A2AB74|nr:glycosyltransferase family 2 protein [Brachybacterium paraconglomeratum]MCT1908735.1 glycosyltransferase family 2 protein [Brachybacterium paraconglomeratum]